MILKAFFFIERNYYGTATQQDHQTSPPQSLSGSYPRTRQSADRRQIRFGRNCDCKPGTAVKRCFRLNFFQEV